MKSLSWGELLKHLAFSERRLTLWHYRTQTDDLFAAPLSLWWAPPVLGVNSRSLVL